MIEISPFRKQIEERIGPIQHLAAIEKGFSIEKKFKVLASQSDYLVRLSPLQSASSKEQEFDIMRQLYENGVQCNQPILMLQNDETEAVCTVYSYLAGIDAEENITKLPPESQYTIGVDAGKDLKLINSLPGETNNWKERKCKKHERYVNQYFERGYRFKNDERILRFIETQYDFSEADQDYLQHDDFHLGNIVIDCGRYAGVLDFNRYDWGDPLHEFVKLEWYNWPLSEAFARGQVEGYFGERKLSEAECLQLSVYIAMSIVSTTVWTLEFHPHTWVETETRIRAILDHFDYFDSIRPEWAT
ncbi:MAG: aminoglycoside phosphotransferase family protein [Chloroflexota bacterium]